MQNIFLEVDSLKGNSTSDQGKDMIEVMSFSHGISMPLTYGPSNTQRAHGRCNHQDLTITKQYDLASVTLNEWCCSGQNIKAVTVHVWQADQSGKPKEYITIKIEEAIITSASVGGSGGDIPHETITFNYGKITWTYGQQEAKGGQKGKNSSSWDLTTNKGVATAAA